ncbi:MAG TPA: N-acetylornithine carbamoyltransferase [Saprospiraceae bacterium]|nr:N-acetylornithine carbamoyltransferase [Saprospiraceae bacterium]HMP13820.1 N-acetylornithine carbamoyltransferase [Saprospiraceae bacterium]
MKKFITVQDVPHPQTLVQEAIQLKANPFAFDTLGKHKTLVMLFFNPSLRTRLSTEKAALNLGMSVMSMNATEGWQLEFEDQIVMNGDKAEHIREAAGVISQYADIIGIRTFPTLSDRERDYADFVINRFVALSTVPVISLESAIRHPLQSLADCMTIEELKARPRPKVVLTWAPHPRALPQAVANSFIEWMKTMDVALTVTHPPGYELHPTFTDGIYVEYDQRKAFEDADFIYCKNWSSYQDYGKILNQDPNWMVTMDKMQRTNQGKFMHCLPVRRNIKVEDAVLDSPASVVLQQANNRTYAAQAVLKRMLEG